MTSSAPAMTGENLRSKTILVVEDDAFFRETIEMYLGEHGVTVRSVRNGAEAIDAIGLSKPDLLILDIIMPKIDGFAVLDTMRRNGWEIPTIVLSNLLDEVESEKCFQLGARAYFVKNDMDAEELWSKIQHYL